MARNFKNISKFFSLQRFLNHFYPFHVTGLFRCPLKRSSILYFTRYTMKHEERSNKRIHLLLHLRSYMQFHLYCVLRPLSRTLLCSFLPPKMTIFKNFQNLRENSYLHRSPHSSDPRPPPLFLRMEGGEGGVNIKYLPPEWGEYEKLEKGGGSMVQGQVLKGGGTFSI